MDTVNPEILAARARLREKMGNGARVGGKGSARLKRRPVVHKSASVDDKKLQATIKRMGLSHLPGVDEVAMIRDDGKALCFNHPKVQVAINANTFLISGAAEEKSAEQLFPMVPELSPEILKKFAAEWQKMQELNASAHPEQNFIDQGTGGQVDDDDDVPDLVDNFEATAEA